MARPQMEVVHATEVHERVILPISRLRDKEFAKDEEEYPKLLRGYEKCRDDQPEVEGTYSDEEASYTGLGFYELQEGKPVFNPRPRKPNRAAYVYQGYNRSSRMTTKASQGGVLPNGKYNRDIRHSRVEEYAETMEAGDWRDLLSDPITVTDDGQIVNGQHRLAAVSLVDWSNVPNNPMFAVIWGVGPKEALLADGSNRTKRDQATIATKLAS